MKKSCLFLSAMALALGASAYAANPFSDVNASDWAYQAVSDLSDHGIIEGYPDGTFKGRQTMTRYELAQIVARLMAKEDRMRAEDRRTVDRLASEYASELETLGVRVSNLEKKIGHIAWSGDARLRYWGTSASLGGKEGFEGRMRINAKATIDDKTYVNGKIAAYNYFKESDGDAVIMERMYVCRQIGSAQVTIGRMDLYLDQLFGGWFYSNAFDGIRLAVPLGKNVNLDLGYGRMSDAYKNYNMHARYAAKTGNETWNVLYESDFAKTEILSAQLKANLKFAKLGLNYLGSGSYRQTFTTSVDKKGYSFEARKAVWGVNVEFPIRGFRLFGDYFADTKQHAPFKDKGKVWTAGIGYGAVDPEKSGSFDFDLAYFKIKGGIYEPGMLGCEAPTMDYLCMQDGRFWLLTGDVTLAPNVVLHGEYAFDSKADSEWTVGEYGDSWSLSLYYLF
jgi:hypothetical protein